MLEHLKIPKKLGSISVILNFKDLRRERLGSSRMEMTVDLVRILLEVVKKSRE